MSLQYFFYFIRLLNQGSCYICISLRGLYNINILCYFIFLELLSYKLFTCFNVIKVHIVQLVEKLLLMSIYILYTIQYTHISVNYINKRRLVCQDGKYIRGFYCNVTCIVCWKVVYRVLFKAIIPSNNMWLLKKTS